MIGLNTFTWKYKMNAQPEEQEQGPNLQPWRFISIITMMRTFDFHFDDRECAITFYIAMNQAIHLAQPLYPLNVNRKVINYIILKEKMKQLAKSAKLGSSIGCILFKGIIKVVQLSPEESLNEKRRKCLILMRMSELV